MESIRLFPGDSTGPDREDEDSSAVDNSSPQLTGGGPHSKPYPLCAQRYDSI